jgi:phospho-N-acetylmuramoyl-pentapeptide-transferase
LDDYLGIRNARNLGLNKRGKFIGQLLIAGVFAVLSIEWVHTSTNLSFTRFSLPGWNLTSGGWIVLAVLVIISSSNAVNLSDGLDGLAAGSGTFCFGVLAIIGYWQFRHFSIYHLHASLDLGLVAVGLVGACLGFLWWNAAPARIFMGDTGALAIGTGLGALCLLMNLDLLLPVIGGLFVAITASVIIQVISFRLFGRRVFRMAPLQHHFELRGWPEFTILVRFWILAGLLAMLGLGIFYGDFLKIAKV